MRRMKGKYKLPKSRKESRVRELCSWLSVRHIFLIRIPISRSEVCEEVGLCG